VLRGNHNRLGYAVLLTTVRFVGVLPDKPTAVPVEVLHVLCRQLFWKRCCATCLANADKADKKAYTHAQPERPLSGGRGGRRRV
jgi:hypothetical protein